MVGLGRLGDLEQAVAGLASERVMVTNLRKERATIELGAVALEGHTRAFLKLQEGCDQFCTYCIVPFSRGKSRSVEPRRMIEAIDELAERGFNEVILPACTWADTATTSNRRPNLEALLEMIAERAPIARVQYQLARPRGIERPDHFDRRAE